MSIIEQIRGGKKLSYSPSLISKYRTELMGYGILFIMLSHATNPNWADIPLLCTLTGKATAMVHTAGFLILSGFGLYYSLAKNPDIVGFYKRRLIRLYIPFLLIALPFYLFFWQSGNETFTDFILNETGLAFFVNGGGYLWYIAISILMYILAPFLYNYMFKGKILLKTFFIVLGLILLFYCLSILCPAYYQHTEIGYAKTFMFVIGLYIGYLSKNNISIKLSGMLLVLLLFIVLVIAKRWFPFLQIIYKDAIPLFGIPVLTILMKLSEGIKTYSIFMAFKWLGKYSLELYIMHVLLKNTLFYAFFDYYGFDDSIVIKRYIVLATLILSFLLCSPIHKSIDKLLVKKSI